MDNSTFIVEGGHELHGEIMPQGAKNEALEVISAVLLTKEEVIISNVPEILDVKNLINLLQGMGVKVKRIERGMYSFKADDIDTEYIESLVPEAGRRPYRQASRGYAYPGNDKSRRFTQI